MPIKVTMPQMGESIFEGTITKWLKNIGEPVDRDEPLFEISTDKVDSEIPSPAAGILNEILVPAGETVQINTVVAILSGEQEAGKTAAAPGKDPEIEAAPAEAGEQVDVPAAETVGESHPEASTVAADEEAATPAAMDKATPAKSEKPGAGPDIRTSPLVRRLAREHGIDLATVEGTGMSGRITKQDIERQIAGQAGEPVAPPVEASPAVPTEGRRKPAPITETVAPAGGILAGGKADSAPTPGVAESETVAMSVMRKAIAEHMVMSRKTSAHVATVFHVDMTAISALRETAKKEFMARNGVKLTFTPFFVKALVDTAREFPILNSSISGDNIVYHRPVNVGIAVALEGGLIVPIVKNAHLKSFTGIVLAIHDLADRARTKRLKPEEVQNGTITVTNPGTYGALFATPIINQPQVAILGVGGIEKRPVVIGDAIAVRPMVYLSMCFDHRVIDGAVADQAMAALKVKLEGWSRWVD